MNPGGPFGYTSAMGRIPAVAVLLLLAGLPSVAEEGRAPDPPLPGYGKKEPPKAAKAPAARPALSEEERRELRDGVAAEPAGEPPEDPAPPAGFRQDPFWLEHRKLILDLRLESLENRLRDRTATRDELAAFREYSAERKRIKKLLKAAREEAKTPEETKD